MPTRWPTPASTAPRTTTITSRPPTTTNAQRALHRRRRPCQREHRPHHGAPRVPQRAQPPRGRHRVDHQRTALAERNAWQAFNAASGFDYHERLFQAARFVTEMEYQHLVFEEFARKVQPMVNLFGEGGTGYHTDLDPRIASRVRPLRLPLRPLDAHRDRRPHHRGRRARQPRAVRRVPQPTLVLHVTDVLVALPQAAGRHRRVA